jgi:SsrA-binding protein
MDSEKLKVVTTNRKAYHEYFVEDDFEAGLVLTGTEIKSIRAGHVNVQESYIQVTENEAWVYGMHIATYEQGNRQNHEPLRPRKLLLHSYEIDRLVQRVQQRGYTVIPLRLLIRKGRAKLQIALAKGKKLYDKRESLAKRDAQRNIERSLRDFQKSR